MTKIIKVNEKIVNELQCLSIEVESRKDLIAFMIDKDMDVNGTKFKEYEEAYQKFYFQYQTAKTEFEKNTLKPMFTENEMVRWNLDFNSCEVTVELKD